MLPQWRPVATSDLARRRGTPLPSLGWPLSMPREAPTLDLTCAGPPRAGGRALPISTGDAVYRPLKTAEAFARDLVHDIVSQGLQTGDKLPPEAAMLEEFGLSRESLREGLRLLEVQGLITLRRGPGGGPIVGHLDPASLGRTSTLYYHLAGGTYAELLEAWVVDRVDPRRAGGPQPRPRGRPRGDGAVPRTATAATTTSSPSSSSPTRTSTRVLASLAENRVLEMMLQTIGQIVTHHVLGHADPGTSATPSRPTTSPSPRR